MIDIIAQLMTHVVAMNGTPEVLVEQGAYCKVRMADSCYVEAWQYNSDSTLVVETVCAPICSSCARIYNKEFTPIRTIVSPYPTAIFPMATIMDGQLQWTDNTSEILDDEEKKL